MTADSWFLLVKVLADSIENIQDGRYQDVDFKHHESSQERILPTD